MKKNPLWSGSFFSQIFNFFLHPIFLVSHSLKIESRAGCPKQQTRFREVVGQLIDIQNGSPSRSLQRMRLRKNVKNALIKITLYISLHPPATCVYLVRHFGEPATLFYLYISSIPRSFSTSSPFSLMLEECIFSTNVLLKSISSF